MSITSANSVFTLAAVGLFPVPQNMQGYAADDAFTVDAIEIGEVMMGVDGQLSAGYTPAPTKITLAFQADSPSITFFDTLIGAEKVTKEKFRLDGTILVPGLGKSFTLTKGFLTSGKPFPDAKKVLQPVQYVVTFETVSAALV